MATLIICLISSDELFREVCGEIVGAMPVAEAQLLYGDTEAVPEADLYIWDFDPNVGVRLDEMRQLRSIVVLDSNDLGLFRSMLPAAAVKIFVKPVNRITLQSFIENQASRRRISELVKTSPLEESLRLDRDELLQRLFEINVRLQDYDHDRTNFLARTVHDLRTPLTALSGYCGLLLTQQVGPLLGEQLEMLQRMNNSIKRLDRLTSDLSELSVCRTSEITSDIRPGDIEAVVDQAVLELSPLFKDKHISVNVQIDSPGEPLLFDSAQIEQVIVNLLDNACKFSPRNSFVTVRGYADITNPHATSDMPHDDDSANHPRMYHLEVSDSGPGIPADRIDSVFEEFASYGGANDRSGTGLRLAVCKTLIHQHRGKISATSTGRGVTFKLALPLGTHVAGHESRMSGFSRSTRKDYAHA